MSVERQAKLIASALVGILREERERQGLSKYAVAAKCGLSQQAIGYTEREETAPTLETVIRITLALDLPPTELFRRAGIAQIKSLNQIED